MDSICALEYARGISGWMRDNELGWLVRTARGLPSGAVWVEVGTWMGRSWSAVALSLPADSTIISVDTFNSGTWDPTVARILAEHGPVLEDFMKVFEEVRTRRSDLRARIIAKLSAEAAMEVEDRSCDVIFIDGDHRLAGVAADLNAWTPKLKPGGLLCGHDISEPGVYAALSGRGFGYDPKSSGSIWWMKQE
jgi:predicted O-methyltransferase YrrM